MLQAAEKGFLDVVRWLYTKFNANPTVNLFSDSDPHGSDEDGGQYVGVVGAAAGAGHLGVVKYLLQAGRESVEEPPPLQSDSAQAGLHSVICAIGHYLTARRSQHAQQMQWIVRHLVTTLMLFVGFMPIVQKAAPRAQWIWLQEGDCWKWYSGCTRTGRKDAPRTR